MVRMSREGIEKTAEGNAKRMRWTWQILITAFVVFSLISTFYELNHAGDLQPDRHFELVHNFYTDYNFYLSRIREGLEGRWTVVEKYTSEPHNGSVIQEMYVLMGDMGRWIGVPQGRSGDVYHAARVILGFTILALIAAFSQSIFTAGRRKSIAIIGFLLAVTASSWPILTSVDGSPRFGGYMPWWSVMDSLQRITFIPHLLAGQSLIIFLVMALTDFSVIRKSGNVLFLGVLACVLGVIFPPGLIFLFAVLGVYGLLRFAKMRAWLTPYAAIAVMSSIALIYLALITSVYPWKRLTELDVLHPLPFQYGEYGKALGPMLPLGVIGVIVALVSGETAMYPAVAWVLAWLILLGVFQFVPQQSPLRFSEMIPHVPLGILTAYAVSVMYEKTRSAVRFLAVLLPTALIILGIGQMYSSFLWQKDFVDHKIRATTPLVPTGSYVMYPLKDFYTAMLYLEDQTKRTDVILSETTAGNYMPVYSGNTVYVGHDNTVNAEVKKVLVSKFYSGAMSAEEAKAWLSTIPTHVIFFGPQEREEAGGKVLTECYPFLTEAYTNPTVTVYTSR